MSFWNIRRSHKWIVVNIIAINYVMCIPYSVSVAVCASVIAPIVAFLTIIPRISSSQQIPVVSYIFIVVNESVVIKYVTLRHKVGTANRNAISIVTPTIICDIVVIKDIV